MNIILVGAPGAGKGSYASRLKKHYDFLHIAIGDLLRKEAKNNKKIQQQIEKGELIDDETVLNILATELKNNPKKGAFIDGFPRTLDQAKLLENTIPVDLVLVFDAAKETVLRRLAGRWTCEDCGEIFHTVSIPIANEGYCNSCNGKLFQRDDDKTEIIEKRFTKYQSQTQPLIDYYKEKVKRIDANKDMNYPKFRVLDDCKEIIGERIKQ